MGSQIKHIEYYFPEKVISNNDLKLEFPDYDFSKFEDKIGIRKGHCYEGAGVSNKHVLALVNNGNAKASDIIELARASRRAVNEKFGIMLEPEVQFVGITL